MSIKITSLLFFISFGLFAQISPLPPVNTIKQNDNQIEAKIDNILELTAQEVLDKSIQYHDPKNSWPIAKHEFNPT